MRRLAGSGRLHAREQPPLLRALRGLRRTEEEVGYRARLHACAITGDPERAMEVLAEMEAAGYPPGSDDTLPVLAAHHAERRAEDAEVYLRTLPAAQITERHLHAVLLTYALAQRPQDAERLFHEFEGGPVPPDDACRQAVLVAFSLVPDHVGARRWFEECSIARGRPLSAGMVASLIDAHGHPDALNELGRLEASLDAERREDPTVAAALVFAFAHADAPESAEERLPLALAVVADPEVRKDLVVACVEAHQRRALSAAIRIGGVADQAGLYVDDVPGWPAELQP